jgi:hypothetical protein
MVLAGTAREKIENAGVFAAAPAGSMRLFHDPIEAVCFGGTGIPACAA